MRGHKPTHLSAIVQPDFLVHGCDGLYILGPGSGLVGIDVSLWVWA